MLLRELLTGLDMISVSGPVDITISSIEYDSRTIGTGSLFVAVPSVGGTRATGGVCHIEPAVQSGAHAVVTEVDVSLPGGTVIRVADARRALAIIATNWYGRPSEKLALFGVTGTDGKTTTTYLLEQILRAAGFRTGLIGTIEIKIGDRRQRNLDRMTTPESADVQSLLQQMVDVGVTHAAVEASSHALALDRLVGCRFEAVALTNITADHVEFHGSWEAYFEAKMRLFDTIACGRPAVLNRDDPHHERTLSYVSGPVLTYGFHPEADLRLLSSAPGGGGTTNTVEYLGERCDVSVPLPGEFNALNALAAFGLALHTGLRFADIAGMFQAVEPPPGRFQRIDEGQPFEVLVDYAHTVNGFESVLSALRARIESPRRLIAVFGSAGNRDRAKRPVLARLAQHYTDFFYVTNEDPFGEDAEAIIDEIMSELPLDLEGTRYRRVTDRGDAIRQAVADARPGDVVVVLGKGHEQSIVVDGRKEPWSDATTIRNALRASR